MSNLEQVLVKLDAEGWDVLKLVREPSELWGLNIGAGKITNDGASSMLETELAT